MTSCLPARKRYPMQASPEKQKRSASEIQVKTFTDRKEETTNLLNWLTIVSYWVVMGQLEWQKRLLQESQRGKWQSGDL